MVLPIFYLGNIAYWKKIVSVESIDFQTNAIVPKKSYTNRTIIATANGLQTLSIPILGGRGRKIPFNELEISYAENWVDKHKMALQSAYSKSPFYEFYMPYFEPILDKKSSSLMEFNLAIFKEVYRILKLKSEYNLVQKNEFIQHEFTPNAFDTSITHYPQVFRYKHPFYPDLSILDLLFCIGPKSHDYLSS